jgi:hypothetical protein
LTPIADRHKVRAMLKITAGLTVGFLVGIVIMAKVVGSKLGEVLATELEPEEAVRILRALQGSG